MGISSYYEVVSRPFLDAIESDQDAASALACLWGHGSGMYAWFSELSKQDIDEIIGTQRVPPRGIKILRDLLAASEPHSAAYIEKTHDEHEAILRSAFAIVRAPNADKLARISIMGERGCVRVERLAVITRERCVEISNLMEQLDTAEIVRHLNLADRTPPELWRDTLTAEMNGLFACYSVAAQRGYCVLTGVT